MGMDDSYSNRLWSDSMALVETPLILSANSHYNHHFNTPLYPYNLSAFQGGSGSSSSNSGGVNGYSYPEHINGSGGGGASSGVDNIFIDTDTEDNAIFDKHPTGEFIWVLEWWCIVVGSSGSSSSSRSKKKLLLLRSSDFIVAEI